MAPLVDRERDEIIFDLYEYAAGLGGTKFGDVANVLALLASAVELGRESTFAAGCQTAADGVAEDEARAARRGV